MTSPEEALAAINGVYGVHAGRRAFHAKGVICHAEFVATPRAAELTRAAHMSGERIWTTARFSNGGGNPNVADYMPDTRGLATSFHLPDGERTDILAQILPLFPFKDPEAFIDALHAGHFSPASLVRFPVLAARNPRLLLTMPANLKAMFTVPASFAALTYVPFHAFKWIDAEGGERWIRYYWKPTVNEPTLSRRAARRRGPDYLFEELRARLEREPVRMDLEVQIAGPGDDPHDPSSAWPDDRERVVVGTLEVAAIDDEADDSIVFDPMRLTAGIEPSDDPVLLYRPPVYDLSYKHRAGAGS